MQMIFHNDVSIQRDPLGVNEKMQRFDQDGCDIWIAEEGQPVNGCCGEEVRVGILGEEFITGARYEGIIRREGR